MANRFTENWTLDPSIYEGFTTEISALDRAPGQRTIAIVRTYQDALAIMDARKIVSEPVAYAFSPTDYGRLRRRSKDELITLIAQITARLSADEASDIVSHIAGTSDPEGETHAYPVDTHRYLL